MYKVSEVAKIFNVSRQTVLYWIKNGTIKAVKPLKDYRISEEEVERLKTTYKGEKENEKN